MKYIICLFFLFHFLFTNIINLFLVAKQSKKNKTKTLTKASKSQPKAKIIDLTQDNVDFDMEERRLSLKEWQLEIDERELRLECERLELQKLKHEYNIQ